MTACLVYVFVGEDLRERDVWVLIPGNNMLSMSWINLRRGSQERRAGLIVNKIWGEWELRPTGARTLNTCAEWTIRLPMESRGGPSKRRVANSRSQLGVTCNRPLRKTCVYIDNTRPTIDEGVG